jgi:single-stranded DNA-binding protein
MHNRSWEGQDGQKRYRTEIVANRVTFLDRQGASAPLSGEKVEEGEVEEIAPDNIMD